METLETKVINLDDSEQKQITNGSPAFVDNFVVISRQMYDDLKEQAGTLEKLYAGGVDNWEWFGACFKDQ